MRLLALETVTRAGSLALCDASGCDSSQGDPSRTHGVRLPGELIGFLTDRRRTLSDIDAFVVVTGPGSFTGLRVGLATIQGIALAQGRPVIGVPTLEAMVNGWLRHHGPGDGFLFACLDGARGDVFYALFDLGGADRFDSTRWTIAPSVETPAVAATRVRAVLAGRNCRAVGDGAERYADALRANLPELPIDSPMPNLAEGAARLALAQATIGSAPHALRPVYIRRPDAELARDRIGAAPDIEISEVTDPAGRAEVSALQGRVFGREWGDDLAGGDANRRIARVHAARDRSGKLIAYSIVWLVLDELHIHSVAVDPAFLRKGVAKILLQRVLEEARASGAASATLEVRASNQAALSLYERLGFKTEAVRSSYYQNPIEDALILWRRAL